MLFAIKRVDRIIYCLLYLNIEDFVVPYGY